MSEQFSIEHRKIEISLVPHNYAKRFAAPISEANKKALQNLRLLKCGQSPMGAHIPRKTL